MGKELLFVFDDGIDNEEIIDNLVDFIKGLKKKVYLLDGTNRGRLYSDNSRKVKYSEIGNWYINQSQ